MMALPADADLNVYFQGQTVRCKVLVYDDDGDLVDAQTSVVIRIADSETTRKVDDSAETKDATGTYRYDHTLPADALPGKWVVEHIITDGSLVTIVEDAFRVRERVA